MEILQSSGMPFSPSISCLSTLPEMIFHPSFSFISTRFYLIGLLKVLADDVAGNDDDDDDDYDDDYDKQ